jgi:hypothetical protein
LSKCTLDIDEPKLVINGNVTEGDLRKGLVALRDKVAQNHKASMWFRHPMPGYPEYKDKVWEWDFKPASDRSFTRPGWRLLAYVPNPNGPEPILARPFICWDKTQAPQGNQETFISNALKKFLSENIKVEVEEDIFRYSVDGQGKNIALCQRCWDRVESADLDELELLKDAHKQECAGHPPI